MTIRLYLAPQTGSGTIYDPIRSILNGLIDVAAGDRFTEIDNPARLISICCVHASQATHDAITADARVLPLGNLCADEAAFRAHLDSLISGLPNLAALKTALEERGISTSWYSGSNTIRDGVRWLVRNFAIAQIAQGLGNTGVKTVIAGSLDLTVGSYPLSVRNVVENWMSSRGLATGWITNDTTIRQVLHFIIENLGFGVLRLSGESF